ncbi:MAG: hypothetical protein RIR14_1733, partial [Pseudomonadota bacterium]
LDLIQQNHAAFGHVTLQTGYPAA